jgi:hypothetical protein
MNPQPEPDNSASVDTSFSFAGLYGCASCCRVRVFPGAAPVVVLTETKENEGTSVTNAVEAIAAQVCDFYALDGAEAVFIEHYPDARPAIQRERNIPDPVFEEHFEAVNFERAERGPGGWRMKQPRWQRLTRAQVEALTGQTWEPEGG